MKIFCRHDWTLKREAERGLWGDYECQKCGKIEERITPAGEWIEKHTDTIRSMRAFQQAVQILKKY